MNTLEFEYENFTYRLEMNSITVIFGGSCTGKSNYINLFENIFTGQEKTAFFNRQSIAKNQFKVKTIKSVTEIT